MVTPYWVSKCGLWLRDLQPHIPMQETIPNLSENGVRQTPLPIWFI